jgi:hypothetical protein
MGSISISFEWGEEICVEYPATHSWSELVNFCENFLILKNLILSSPGDLDRNNEEIEVEVKTEKNTLDCGLFLFDIAGGVDERPLDILLPCDRGELVSLLFIERDNCDDDRELVSIRCDYNGGITEEVVINIEPEYTKTSRSNCISHANAMGACLSTSLSAPINQAMELEVGGSACTEYIWGESECSGEELSETISEYYLRYKIIESDPNHPLSCHGIQSPNWCRDGTAYPGLLCGGSSPITIKSFQFNPQEDLVKCFSPGELDKQYFVQIISKERYGGVVDVICGKDTEVTVTMGYKIANPTWCGVGEDMRLHYHDWAYVEENAMEVIGLPNMVCSDRYLVEDDVGGDQLTFIPLCNELMHGTTILTVGVILGLSII